MRKVKKPVKFKSLSIPEPLFKEIKIGVQKSSKYRTMAEFLRESIRLNINALNLEKHMKKNPTLISNKELAYWKKKDPELYQHMLKQ